MLITFGNTTIGTIDDVPNNDAKFVYPFTSVQAGLIIKATGYLSGLGSGVGNQPMKVVVYDDNTNAPGNLVAVSDELVIVDGSAYQWYDFWFSTQARLLANSPYWLGYHAGSPINGNQVKENSGNSFRYQNPGLDTYSDGASSPFGTISGTASGTITLNLTIDDESTYISSLGRRPVPMIKGPDRDRVGKLWRL
jgi:hypothetical protein